MNTHHSVLPRDGVGNMHWTKILEAEVGRIFTLAQKTTSSHRKNVTQLRNIMECCLNGRQPFELSEGGRRAEKIFCMTFMKLLSRALIVPKKEVAGDRVLRFVDSFLMLMVDTDIGCISTPRGSDGPQSAEIASTKSSTYRLITYIFKCLIPLLPSKEKSVRYRTTQLIAMLMTSVLAKLPYEHDLEMLVKLKDELIARIGDKEAAVRIQSAIALINFYQLGMETSDSGDDDAVASDLTGVLIDALQNDPNSDARRAILVNMPISEFVLPYLLERARDVDASTRKLVFSKILPELGDFRQLTNTMRMKILTWGLNDRDRTVRDATAYMFNYRWIEDAEGDILEVLERMHLIGTDGVRCDTSTLELAMRGFWGARKDIIKLVQFDSEFWEVMTPESAFLARTFNDHCKSELLVDTDYEDKMPEVTKLAYYLQMNMNKLLLEVTREVPDTAGEADLLCPSTTAIEQEFIVEQLLLICKAMDYSDEIGRRKMFSLMRDSLAITTFSDEISKLIVQVLAKISLDEKDFCMVALEVIAEIQDKLADNDHVSPETSDNMGDDESFHSAFSDVDEEDAVKVARDDGGKARSASTEEATLLEMSVNLKSLLIAQCMLENVHGELMQNSHLVTMLNGLVVPAVRSHEASIRELGLRCLGLSCLLDKSLAEDNLTLFAHCFNKGHESLQVESLRIISDILMVHGPSIFSNGACALEERTLYRLMVKAIKLCDAEEVQTCAVEVACKLLLAQVVQDSDLLRSLVLIYFDQDTADNAALRQTLAYFLPVFFHSSFHNQSKLQRDFITIIQQLLLMYESADQTKSMVAPSVFTHLLLEWADPRKNINFQSGSLMEDGIHDGHVLIAIDAMEKCSDKSCQNLRKLLISLLSKLYIPRLASNGLLQKLHSVLAELMQGNLHLDAVSTATITRAELSLAKLLEEVGRE
ncbi:hypothetical protein BJ508DRAFT_107527 [Ascobolus immersus RN42]|uniref:Nuclear condensin complex subunit 3 C-terminal domain-containing protein n=1 Tax=Ascobolus immersus RN42 TaxID=1160509 RepID=A0A3N4ICG0_ASCIM|nr:hypothetical protein BJ508DRAFT_107527 [Ascobolus immersus RN42]